MLADFSSALLETPDGKRADEILRKCVHCGLCNTACPTYSLLGNELDGPRGRIYLIKSMLEEDRPNAIAHHHLDRCLTCLSCQSACPSGVNYGELLDIGRRFVRVRSWSPKGVLVRALLFMTSRAAIARPLMRLARLVRLLLPRPLQETLATPVSASKTFVNPGARVILLRGCVQSVLTPQVTDHLAGLLSERGVEFSTAKSESCCGGLHAHLGFEREAQSMARANLRAIGTEAGTVILSSASGCGRTLKEYGRLLPSEPDAATFANQVQDVSEYLKSLRFSKRDEFTRIAFHSPCTLQHGQQIRGVIEELLVRAGYTLSAVADGHSCCGSAGTYSILQPELSRELREARLAALGKSRPDAIATANVGCQLHLAAATDTPVLHWIELLQ